ncbi:carbohydrate/starch-binding module (family 21) domain-containing protein [Hirsutella rhossiliensis]|uniref:Carbohydrate/starch-binding module (Family 21) domain-containing protein n=1 Tax=Hirsutella rhossiliensis TaxID=111463 RepID=A0A9P8SMI1_9HYPO|nr:carbohydrate/starch-binding module (family 21) domain-containing protein [Hirsutella rhossiliensis]KAH0966156.1 carbohydrate/starch-binding module (family 21) domain-containing protein [Hirsutella rhossiliensis]
MPYTPPSHSSPASSVSTSPDASRRSSIQFGSRPSLPRSSSYLNKHRRTPSISATDDSPLGSSDVAQTLRNTVANLGGSGAIVSPPESASSGSDEDEPPGVRGRQLESLKDLRDAVSQIPQTRTPSPPPTAPAEGGRKLSHVRSATEPNAPMLKSTDSSLTVSDEDTDEDLRNKPPMVRKNMPGTPVFSKAVHFDSHLEHVRHFLQVDRPLAVSAGSSPVESYESDGEYPFPSDAKSAPRSPPYEWELVTANFPHNTQKSMLGSIAVANLAFQKQVSCRFTLDYWKTVSEVSAEYGHEIRPRQGTLAHDRFTFVIKLSDMANLESKTLFFCIRYAVDGQEFWDNNSSTNFQVDFRKKHLPQNGKNNFTGAASRPLNGLPRSNRRPMAASALRPVSMPMCLDAFGKEPNKITFDQPIHEYLGESGPTGLRLKTKSSPHLASDNIARNLSSPSGVAFSNRYDFGASLSAAMEAAKDSAGRDKDALYMKRNVRGLEPTTLAALSTDSPVLGTSASDSPNGAQSPNSSLPSVSYEELVNKYCFFGSKQASPTMNDGTLRGGAFDGAKGGLEASNVAASRLKDGPRASTALHHSIRLPDSSSYFPSLMTTGSAASTPPTLAGDTRIPFAMPVSMAPTRPTAPVLASGGGTPPGDVSYHSQQQVLSELLPWMAETQSATAILG